MMGKILPETEKLIELIEKFFTKQFPMLREIGVEKIETTDMNLLQSCLNLINVLCVDYKIFRTNMEETRKKLTKKKRKTIKLHDSETRLMIYN